MDLLDILDILNVGCCFICLIQYVQYVPDHEVMDILTPWWSHGLRSIRVHRLGSVMVVP